MKINLMYGTDSEQINGYTNIHPFTLEETDELIRGDIKNLDFIVDDAEVEEIIATDVVDYISVQDIEQVIENWVSKLHHEGTIVIGGVDFLEVCKSVTRREIEMDDVIKMIHGVQDKPYLIKRNNLTCGLLAEYLNQRYGLKIIKKRSEGFKYIVEAKRP